MFKTIKKIVKYPRVTQEYPFKKPNSDLFIGKPVLDASKCSGCGQCVTRCPSSAIASNGGSLGINYDECIFCSLCQEICPAGAMQMTHDYELAQPDRGSLRTGPLVIDDRMVEDKSYEVICNELQHKIKKVFGRSLQIREVDSGSCNGCDYEVDAMNNPFNDIERLGIHFVASPRHADMLLVTGAAVRNMELALVKTYNAAPDPKLVVAVGACACSGGIFKDTYATRNGIDSVVPVDVYVPGCPPRPQAIMYGILKALDKVR